MKNDAESGLAVILPLVEQARADVIELKSCGQARQEAIVRAAAKLHRAAVLAVPGDLRESVGATKQGVNPGLPAIAGARRLWGRCHNL